jgi:hypothetical protein
MNVYIANFGKGNWAWLECLRRGTIAVMDDERVHPFWLNDDREGYIQQAQKVLRSSSGGPVIKTVASRWFATNTILKETAGDLWIHREKGELWWTESIESVPEVTIIDDPYPRSGPSKIFLYHKRCTGWSDKNKKGGPLRWDGLHPRAREFLFTEGTFQKPSESNAAYAQAMIAGADLTEWHDRTDWRAKADRAKRAPVNHFDSRRKTIVRMAMTAMSTAAQSGDISLSIKKDKHFLFHDKYDLENYVSGLLEDQEQLCALTGLRLLLDDDDGDPELRCSLDRIHSDRHYERGNLQIVCCFANRWKSAADNEAFLKLIEIVRSGI